MGRKLGLIWTEVTYILHKAITILRLPLPKPVFLSVYIINEFRIGHGKDKMALSYTALVLSIVRCFSILKRRKDSKNREKSRDA
jgi:hypothetical protein